MRRARWHRSTVAALATCGLLLSASGVAVAAPRQDDPVGIGVRLVDAPVDARDDPRARIYIVDHLAPGAVIQRRIEISNTTSAAHEVALYASAATIGDGSFVGSADRTPNELSSWTTVDPGASDIAAGGRVTATVTITVPDDAAPGEQYGVVWAETRSDDEGGGVVQVSRVGIRLYVSVGPGGPPAADFTIESLTAGRTVDGTPTISAAVRNTGGRALDLDGTLRLSDGPGGLSAGPFAAETSSTLAVGATEPVSIELDERLPAGPWTARVDMVSGLVERSAEAVVTFPDAGPGVAVAAAPGRSRPVWLYITAAIVALLLVVGLALLWWRRRARSPQFA